MSELFFERAEFIIPMIEKKTDYGRVLIGEKTELFAEAVHLVESERQKKMRTHFSWALTGGNTPQEFYDWCVRTSALPEALAAHTNFFVSDERHVPLNSDQSNFGNAERRLLVPYEVPTEHRHPWFVAYPPEEAAEAFRRTAMIVLGPGRGFDVCFLGMGDDAHTASFFPGNPDWQKPTDLLFDAYNTTRGWRLTITTAGLRASRNILVMTVGAGKAQALKRVIAGPYDPANTPAQILKMCAANVTWLVDPAAASLLE